MVLGFLKYPDNILVVNTAVLLEPDKENFYYLLDMWNSQVVNNTNIKQEYHSSI